MRALHHAYPPVYLRERDFATLPMLPDAFRSGLLRAPG